MVVTHLTIVVNIVIIIRLFVLRLKPTLSLVLTLGSEASLCLAHFIKFRIVLVVDIIFEDLVLLVLNVLIFQLLNHLLLLGASLAILQVVHIELVL